MSWCSLSLERYSLKSFTLSRCDLLAIERISFSWVFAACSSNRRSAAVRVSAAGGGTDPPSATAASSASASLSFCEGGGRGKAEVRPSSRECAVERGKCVVARRHRASPRTSLCLSLFFFFFFTPPAAETPPLSFNPPFTTCWYDSLISRATKCALVSVVGETSIDQCILNDVWFHSSPSDCFRKTVVRQNRRSEQCPDIVLPRLIDCDAAVRTRARHSEATRTHHFAPRNISRTCRRDVARVSVPRSSSRGSR